MEAGNGSISVILAPLKKEGEERNLEHREA